MAQRRQSTEGWRAACVEERGIGESYRYKEHNRRTIGSLRLVGCCLFVCAVVIVLNFAENGVGEAEVRVLGWYGFEGWLQRIAAAEKVQIRRCAVLGRLRRAAIYGSADVVVAGAKKRCRMCRYLIPGRLVGSCSEFSCSCGLLCPYGGTGVGRAAASCVWRIGCCCCCCWWWRGVRPMMVWAKIWW
jgi:hypothetical protein